MMSSLHFALLLLLLTATSASARQLPGNIGGATVDEPVVTVVSALPNNTEARRTMQIQCKYGITGYVIDQELGAGEKCSWTAMKDAVYRCYAQWTNEFTLWNAFQPRRDAGRGRVLWQVREEGIFLNVNGTSWVRKALWGFE